ncbi:MAG: dual specificity protein phosphatase [Synechococcaceae cyanobacterium]
MPDLPFRLSWLLVDELAIGTAPLHDDSLDQLEQEGVAAVLSLCSELEAPAPPGLAARFRIARVELPDQRAGRWPRAEELQAAMLALHALRSHGPVYVHCVAAMERSPLLAIAWLMATRDLSLESALAYVQATHPGTAPFSQQLEVLRIWRGRFSEPFGPLALRAAA